jgi:hypothetical protein
MRDRGSTPLACSPRMKKTHLILAALFVLPFASACDRSGSSTDDKSSASTKSTAAAAEFSTSDALIEALPFGTVAWNVRVDGTIEASVKAEDAARTTGLIQWREGDEEKTANLTEDPAKHTLVATGPKLSADVTDIRYTLQHDDKSVDGVLQVPPGGTAQLVADSKATPSIDEGAVGPHGGTVQAVGDDRLEIVAEGTDVHVFLVDAKLQAIASPSDDGRTITIAAAEDSTPHTITLTFDASLGAFTAKWTLAEDPTRMTIAVKKGNVVHATLAGWKPGLALAIGKKAKPIKVHVAMGGGPKNDLAKDDDDKGKAKANGKDKIKDDPADKDNGKGNDKDKPGAKPASVKVEGKPGEAKPEAKPDPKANPGKGNDKPKSK